MNINQCVLNKIYIIIKIVIIINYYVPFNLYNFHSNNLKHNTPPWNMNLNFEQEPEVGHSITNMYQINF